MTEKWTIHVMKQVLAGVDFLHRQLGIAHRDLSLENVLMHNGACKISDFGLSVAVNTLCLGRAGKEYYMAPEVVAGGSVRPREGGYLVAGYHVVRHGHGVSAGLSCFSSKQGVPRASAIGGHRGFRVVGIRHQAIGVGY
ncbi:hypothetical protein ON010_g11054 [Phytophthora cinnamomi]|nr:hypothetical protein ON010_g11054 [Phytophthora cinnamomi]